MRILTIGGYGFTERNFFSSIQNAGIDCFVDVRQRRGMRGSKYSFLNSNYLQNKLLDMNVKYIHEKNLAPTSDIRAIQFERDRSSGLSKRDRSQLSQEFVDNYKSIVLKNFDIEPFLQSIQNSEAMVLFCVEGPPLACHRIWAASHLAGILNIPGQVEHLKL